MSFIDGYRPQGMGERVAPAPKPWQLLTPPLAPRADAREALIIALSDVIKRLGGDAQIQAALGSYGDTAGPAETLDAVRDWLES
jgi:hypothetical protein